MQARSEASYSVLLQFYKYHLIQMLT